MSLTEKGYQDRMWGDFPSLRIILEDAKIPDHYYGPSSASDHLSDRVNRLITIAILIRENKETIKGALREALTATRENQISEPPHLLQDLDRFRRMMEGIASHLRETAEEIYEIRNQGLMSTFP